MPCRAGGCKTHVPPPPLFLIYEYSTWELPCRQGPAQGLPWTLRRWALHVPVQVRLCNNRTFRRRMPADLPFARLFPPRLTRVHGRGRAKAADASLARSVDDSPTTESGHGVPVPVGPRGRRPEDRPPCAIQPDAASGGGLVGHEVGAGVHRHALRQCVDRDLKTVEGCRCLQFAVEIDCTLH